MSLHLSPGRSLAEHAAVQLLEQLADDPGVAHFVSQFIVTGRPPGPARARTVSWDAMSLAMTDRRPWLPKPAVAMLRVACSIASDVRINLRTIAADLGPAEIVDIGVALSRAAAAAAARRDVLARAVDETTNARCCRGCDDGYCSLGLDEHVVGERRAREAES